jgi:leader peptidase (prepilin peptidase) / N-methyltransferase
MGFDLLSHGPSLLLAVLLGLLVGSFLNVVIHRLPRMLEAQWARECAEFSQQPVPEAPPLNLLVPRSRCPSCAHPIGWHQNIPVLSFLWLRGRCAACRTPIGWRYPAVELLTATGFAWVYLLHGATPAALAWGGFVALLITLAAIDWDTTLLPDDLTLPLLWGGLVATALGWTGLPLADALWGAVAGYGSLWAVYWAFKLITGKEGMGYGDFKLFAALGAWLGWQALVPVILVASLVGAVVGIAMKFSSGLREGGYIPFGPFLVLGGVLTWLLGSNRWWTWLGL